MWKDETSFFLIDKACRFFSMCENCTCELGIVFKKCSMCLLRLEKN